MTREEINRYIHVEIRGKGSRIHTWNIFPGEPCWGCGLLSTPDNLQKKCSPVTDEHIPDYCSDNSSRSLLNEVVAAVAEPNSYSHFSDTLLDVISRSHSEQDWREYNNGYFDFLMFTATSEQIARACVEAHKGMGARSL